MRPKLLFRADGSESIGFGHVHRLLSLVQLLYRDFNCTFVSHDNPPFLKDELDKIDVPFYQVPAVNYVMPDLRKPGDEVSFDMDHLLLGDEIVILDGYWFGKNYQTAVQKKGCTLVYVDDLVEGGNRAEAVINHSLGLQPSDYRQTGPSTALYIGSAYTLVRIPAAFRSVAERSEIFDQLLIAMGGADPLDYTGKVVSTHADLIAGYNKVLIMVGPGYRHGSMLLEKVRSMKNVEIIRAVPRLELYHIMQQSSAAIMSASTMCMEYASIGGALAIIRTAENQKFLYKGMVGCGAALPVESMAGTSPEFFKSMMAKQLQLFDGNSGERLGKLFGELSIQHEISFTKASPEHLELTYEWASDPGVRAYSFNREPIGFEEHKKWYLSKIVQSDCIYLLGRWGNEIVGSLRFDISGPEALISYLVSPKHHRKGLGRILLAKGLQYLAANNSHVQMVTGLVLPDNTASVRIFDRLGFSCIEENNQLRFTKSILRL
jgi:spore coat polysaccharide biosynthesis predicted glycosyltransferase SpsG/RimJ/RimL family protein N-acetyltransferase